MPSKEPKAESLVRKALSEHIGVQITCGDSEIVLHWILSDHRRLDPWHRNRVVQIRRSLDLDHLYHVSSKNNPADIGTRPSSITEADVGPDSRYEKGDMWMTHDVQVAIHRGFITPAANIKLSPEKEPEFKDGLMIMSDHPEVIVRGHSVVRRDLIAERAEYSKGDPDLLPTKRKWPVMVRITTLVITFISKILKRLGRTFKGPLLASCRVKLHVAMVDCNNSEQSPQANMLLFEYSSLVVYVADQPVADSTVVLSDLAEEDVGQMFLLTQVGTEVGYSVGRVQLVPPWW